MTIYELTNQLHSLSVGGYFNREQFTVERLQSYIESMLRTGDSLTMEIAMPDGWWYFTISKWVERGHFRYAYYIPETREQESHVKEMLFNKSGQSQ